MVSIHQFHPFIPALSPLPCSRPPSSSFYLLKVITDRCFLQRRCPHRLPQITHRVTAPPPFRRNGVPPRRACCVAFHFLGNANELVQARLPRVACVTHPRFPHRHHLLRPPPLRSLPPRLGRFVDKAKFRAPLHVVGHLGVKFNNLAGHEDTKEERDVRFKSTMCN